jgi:hypothetical protein
MWDWFSAWMQNQPQNWQGPIISGIVTVFTAVIGLFVIWTQLRAQRNNLATQLNTQQELLVKQLETQAVNTAALNRDNEGIKLKKDIYVEVGKITKQPSENYKAQRRLCSFSPTSSRV